MDFNRALDKKQTMCINGIFVLFVFLSHFGQYETMPWDRILSAIGQPSVARFLFYFLGQYVFEIYILQRVSMNLFNGCLAGWVYLMACILVTLILAYCFKKLEAIIDSYIF